MYFSLLQDKRVHIVGPFRNIREFLEWKKEEKISGTFRAMDCQLPENDAQCVVMNDTTITSKEF